MARADLNIRIGSDIKNLLKGLSKAERAIKQTARQFDSIGRGLTQSLSIPLAAAGAASLSAFSKFEQAAKGLEAIMGSARAAEREIGKLKEVAKNPGLALDQAIKGSVRLQAVGFSADLSRNALLEFGNALALAGGSAADLDGVSLALTQIASKGKISAEEINQLAERVPQIRTALIEAFGTSEGKELEKLGVTATNFVEGVIDEFRKLPRASNTLSNSFNNAFQAVQAFAVSVGGEINKAFNIQGRVENLSKFLNNLSDAFSNLDDSTKKGLIRLSAFVIGIGPALLAVGKFIQLGTVITGTIKLMTVGFGKLAVALNISQKAFQAMALASKATIIGAVVAAVVALGFAFSQLNQRLNESNKVQQNLVSVQNQAAASAAEETAKIDPLISILKDETKTRKERANALKDLQQQAPGYFGTLDLEKSKVEDITKAYEGYKKSILLAAQAQAVSQRLTELARQEIEIQAKAFEKASGSGTLFERALDGVKGVTGIAAAEAADENRALNLIAKERQLLAEKFADINKEIAASDTKAPTTTTSRGSTATTGEATGPAPTAIPVFDSLETKALETQKVIQSIFSADSFGSLLGEDVKQLQAELTQLGEVGRIVGDSDLAVLEEKIGLVSAALRNSAASYGENATSTTVLQDQLKALQSQYESLKIAFDETSSLEKVNKELQEISEVGKALGTSDLEVLKSQINAVNSALGSAVATFGAGSESAEYFGQLLESLNIQFEDLGGKAVESVDKLNESIGNVLSEALVGLSVSLGEIIGNLVSGVGKAANLGGLIFSTLGGVLKQLGKIAIETGIGILAIKEAFKSLNPFVAIAAGVALVALGTVVQNSVAELATGGIIPPGFPNDTYPALLSSGETVLPAAKPLPSGYGQAGPVEVVGVISGKDILLANERAQKAESRIR